MSEPAQPLIHPTDSAGQMRLKEAVAQAEADIAAGRTVAHEDVRRWLLSWGSSNEQTAPKAK